MTANLNDVAINQIIDKMVSYLLASGRFDAVNGHEPKSAPTSNSGVTAAVWAQSVGPAVGQSGQAATTALIVFNVRFYMSFLSQPFDAIDPTVLAATTDFMGAMSGDFEFGGVANVRNVDLLGICGTTLNAIAGYMEIDRKYLRIMTVTVPIIVNDAFTQVA